MPPLWLCEEDDQQVTAEMWGKFMACLSLPFSVPRAGLGEPPCTSLPELPPAVLSLHQPCPVLDALLSLQAEHTGAMTQTLLPLSLPLLLFLSWFPCSCLGACWGLLGSFRNPGRVTAAVLAFLLQPSHLPWGELPLRCPRCAALQLPAGHRHGRPGQPAEGRGDFPLPAPRLRRAAAARQPLRQGEKPRAHQELRSETRGCLGASGCFISLALY